MPRTAFNIYGQGHLDTSRMERQLRRFVRKAERTNINLSLNSRKFTQPLGRITGAASEFTKSLEASNARVLAFGASAGVLYGMVRAFTALFDVTVKVEKSLADMNVILQLNTKNLQKFSAQLFKVASDTGQAFETAATAATEFSRQGLGAVETIKRTRDAMILMRLSGLGAVESVEALTAAMNSFGNITLNTTQIINKMAKVDAAFAVSSADLANSLKRVGATAESAGLSLNELMAVTAATQQMTARGGAVIGNALKSIFTRMRRTQVIDQLKQLGVQVKDTQGRMIPAMKVLDQLAKKMKNLSEAQKAHITELVAGVFQMNNLRAILKDMGKEYSFYNLRASWYLK